MQGRRHYDTSGPLYRTPKLSPFTFVENPQRSILTEGTLRCHIISHLGTSRSRRHYTSPCQCSEGGILGGCLPFFCSLDQSRAFVLV